MKTIGLIGGMSWESTAHYYQAINQGIKQRLGGLHSAKIALVSVDFQPIADFQRTGNWQEATKILVDAAIALEKAGADFFLICTNTMHKVAEEVQQAVSIPLLHIADVTGKVLKEQNITKIALLGTRFTMDEAFYKQRLSDKFGLEVLVPTEPEKDTVHSVIYNELCLGNVIEQSRDAYLTIINGLENRGAQGVILGCTEIGMLVQQQHTQLPLFDTTQIHALGAIELAL